MKKNKWIVLFIIFLTVFSFSACIEELEHEHTWNEGEITTLATCTTDGVKTYTCTGCGETKTEVIAAPGHNIKFFEAKAPSCVCDGYKSHYKCTGCNTMYSDASGETEIPLESIIVAKTGAHTLTLVKKVDETCTTNGTIAHYHCSVCNNNFSDEAGNIELTQQELSIAATGHSFSSEWTYSATEHWHAATCGHDAIRDKSTHTWDASTSDGEGTTTYKCQICHATKTEHIYTIGSRGPAGGIVFYDKGNNSDGWRYLEVAPYDLFLLDGWKPSVDAEDPNYMEGEEQFYFGYVSNFYASQKTGTAIGTGKANTEECWSCLKASDVYFSDPFYSVNYNEDLSAFGSHFGESVDIGKTYPMFPLQLYAVKLCKMLYYNGFADWFLPSKDEMQYLYDYLDSTNSPYLARNGFYWTSSAVASDSIYVVGEVNRINNLFNPGRIRPIRAFSDSLDDCIHEFVETITPPTCTQCGFCERTCKNCGYSYTFRNAKPLGHEYEIQIGQITRCKTCNEIIYGPAGGFVFYDCDEDNETGNADGLISTECGWRYLEVTPEPYVCYYEGYAYGAYRTTSNGKNLYSNGSIFYSEGTSDPNDGKCTGTAIGTGKANTIKLLNSMGESAYCKSGVEGSGEGNTTPQYIAKIYSTYELNGFDDWFLPSRDEMIKLYEHIINSNDTTLGFSHNSFWTSSEDGKNHDNALYITSGARVFSESRENYVTQCVLIPIRQVEAD